MGMQNDPQYIYNQLEAQKAGLNYVNGVINGGDLEQWEMKEYCALQLGCIAKIADLEIAIENFETAYGKAA